MLHLNKIRNMRLSTATILIFYSSLLFAQWGPGYEAINIQVYPAHDNWTYELGEEVIFKVQLFLYGSPIGMGNIDYIIGPEKMEATKEGSMSLSKGINEIKGGTMTKPGFLRCAISYTLEGKTYRKVATAAFSPTAIKPTTDEPQDFLDFWESAKLAAAKIPMDPIIEKIDKLCNDQIDVYQVSLQNFRLGSRIYGVLNVPKTKEPMGAILKVPGAGVWPAFMAQDEDAKHGFIAFENRIHGIPMISDEERMYGDLWNSAAHEYWNYNLDDKDRYYYKRVYLGCIRAIDYVFSLPQFDGKNLGVSGGSQGGALSMVTASLDDRVRYLVAYYPALCDLTGYLHDRAGGWPHFFNRENKSFNAKPDKIETSRYYDVVNFARHIKVPGYYAWGFNDEVCPPTSMYAAYNVVSADKQIFVAPIAGHHDFPEQKQATSLWLRNKLGGN